VLLERLFEDLSEISIIEQPPMQEGRNMTMLLGPSKGASKPDGDETAPDQGEGAVVTESGPAAEATADSSEEASG
jgi:translation initiation factor IF-3